MIKERDHILNDKKVGVGQLNKPELNNHNCETVHTKLEGSFGPNGPLCFIPLLSYLSVKHDFWGSVPPKKQIKLHIVKNINL